DQLAALGGSATARSPTTRSTPPATVRPARTYWVAVASEPVTVSRYGPLRADAGGVTVIVASVPGGTGFGLNATPVPAGCPVAARVTGDGLPTAGATRTV